MAKVTDFILFIRASKLCEENLFKLNVNVTSSLNQKEINIRPTWGEVSLLARCRKLVKPCK